MAILKTDLVRQFTEVYAASDKKKIVDFYFQDKWAGKNTFSEEEAKIILNDAQLLAEGVPLSHVTGIAYFYGYTFKVNQHILIPRPETEELVEWVLKDDIIGKEVLDIGTGSGCIPITLSLLSKPSKLEAWDISPEAIKMAAQNATDKKVDLQLVQADILNLRHAQADSSWDIIISNPPYVKRTEATDSIIYEPELALFVPEHDPIVFYRKIGMWALKALKPEGRLYFELSEFTYKDVEKLMKELGYSSVELKKDMQGKVRMMRSII